MTFNVSCIHYIIDSVRNETCIWIINICIVLYISKSIKVINLWCDGYSTINHMCVCVCLLCQLLLLRDSSTHLRPCMRLVHKKRSNICIEMPFRSQPTSLFFTNIVIEIDSWTTNSEHVRNLCVCLRYVRHCRRWKRNRSKVFHMRKVEVIKSFA